MQEVDNPTKFNKQNTNIIVSHLRSLLVFGVEDLSSKLSISKLFHSRFKLPKTYKTRPGKGKQRNISNDTYQTESVFLY
nr:hypothetical protein CFP56_02027 [Quercus suber]